MAKAGSTELVWCLSDNLNEIQVKHISSKTCVKHIITETTYTCIVIHRIRERLINKIKTFCIQ